MPGAPVTSGTSAVAPTPSRSVSGTKPPVTSGSPLDARSLHILRRTTFGLSPELVAEVRGAGGVDVWLQGQFAPASLPDDVCDQLLTRFPLAFADPPEVFARLQNGAWDSMTHTVQATFARQAYSRRQLFEVVVDVFSNHLNITAPSSEPWANRAWHDREVVRRHAFGRFEDMLVASMTSPAMMLYLNNAQSTKTAPNENYGRELLELHTVGVDAGYGQAGVDAAARVMTGVGTWTPWNGGTAANLGTLRYDASAHAVGPVAVLGWSAANADASAGLDVVRSLGSYLARHPATARRVVEKLVVRFVSDVPPPALVDSLTSVYLQTGTAILPVLKTLFASPEFAAGAGQKCRRPAEDVLATVRAVGMVCDPFSTSGSAIGDLVWELSQMDNAPLGWHPPNGYPDVADAWSGAGTTLARWNTHMALAGGWYSAGVTFPPLLTRLVGTVLPATRAALVDALVVALLPGLDVPAAHRSALVGFLGPDGPLEQGDTTWMFGPLVALVLDSPYWSVR